MLRKLLFLACFLACLPARAQTYSVNLDSVHRFYLTDHQAHDVSWFTVEYEIVKEGKTWRQYVVKKGMQTIVERRRPFENSEERTFVADIPTDTMQKIVQIFQRIRLNEPCTLEDFGINKQWIDNFAPTFCERIIEGSVQEEYRDTLRAHRQEIMQTVSSEEFYYEQLVNGSGCWTSDYPLCAIRLDFNNGDTLHLVTESQARRMPIWKAFRRVAEERQKSESFCAPALSQWLGHRFLSWNGWSNKVRLIGEHLMSYYPWWLAPKNVPASPTQILPNRTRMSKEAFDSTQLRKWEKEWRVSFVDWGDNECKLLVVHGKDSIWRAETLAIYLSEQRLLEAIQDARNYIGELHHFPVFLAYQKQIESATIYPKEIVKRGGHFETKDICFYNLQTAYDRCFYLFQKKKMAESMCFVEIKERNGARSFWAWEAGKRLILWKYDENSAFAALDTAGKARKRFPTDTERFLMEEIR